MAKYLFVYHGGGAPPNPADVQKVMDAWGAWFGSMGAAVIDGGNPVGKSSTVKPDGSLVDGGGPERVAGRHHHLAALACEPGGELADGGRLTGAVDADEEDNFWLLRA